MDYIKAEIESKKRALSTLATATVGTGPASKYMKRSDLERQRVELLRAEEDAEQMARAAAKGKGKRGTPVPQREEPESREGEQPGVSTPELVAKSETFNVTAEDAVRRLRAKGQPIRLFGETDKERRLRLRALELIEERTEGQRNEFAKVMEGVQLGLDFEQVSKAGASELVKKTEGEEVLVLPEGEAVDKVQSPKDKEVLVNLMLVKNDPHKVYPQIYHALKVRRPLLHSTADTDPQRILKEWAQSMHERPDEIKRSTQGKIVAATQQSSAEYLKPLFKSLRNRVRLQIAELHHLTSCAGTRTRRPSRDRRNHAQPPDSRVSQGKRRLPATVDRKCTVADRRHHGWYPRACGTRKDFQQQRRTRS